MEQNEEDNAQAWSHQCDLENEEREWEEELLETPDDFYPDILNDEDI